MDQGVNLGVLVIFMVEPTTCLITPWQTGQGVCMESGGWLVYKYNLTGAG